MIEFDVAEAVPILARTPAVLRELVAGLPDRWITSTEGGETWSAFDVVGHFIHGEKTDWIPRAELMLSDRAERRFEVFDRFAQFRDSAGKTLEELLDEFARLREKNLATLRSWNLDEEALQREGVHPEFGRVTLRQHLATWVAHDLDHVAQIARIMARQYSEEVGPWRKYLGILTR